MVNGTNEDKVMDSVVSIELLAFFSSNPHARDTMTGLAARINRSQKQVKKALLKLVRAKILQQCDYGEVTIYRLRQSFGTKQENSEETRERGE